MNADPLFCLACRKPLNAQADTCPSCGAAQSRLRSQRLAAAARPKSAPPPEPLPDPNAPLLCPTCRCTSPPGSTRCYYCGHGFVDFRDPESAERGSRKTFVICGIACCAAALLGFIPVIMGMLGVVLGTMAFAENTRYRTGLWVVAGAIVCAIAGTALNSLRAGG